MRHPIRAIRLGAMLALYSPERFNEAVIDFFNKGR
jgi:hypothetical protein